MENVQVIAYRFNNLDELEHSGVKGMKWGQRRFQNADGSLTTLGRIHYGIKTKRTAKKRAENLEKARAAKAAKKQAAEEEAKKKAEQEAAEAKAKEEKAAEKERIIKSGSAEDALKIVGELNPQEMQYISSRIQWEQNMKNITAKETAEEKSKVDEFFKSMDKAVDYAQTGAKMYNTVANVVNAFNGERVMPKIDTNIKDGNKKDIKDRKKEVKKQQEAAAKRAQQEAEGDAKREERAKKKGEAEKNNQQSKKDKTESSSSTADNGNSKAHGVKGMKWGTRKSDTTDDKKVYTGTVEGEGTSTKKNTSEKKSKSADYYDPIDVGWKWANDSDFNAPAVYNSGRDIVSGYLEDKYR